MARVRKPRLKARVAIERDGCILCVLHAKPNQEPFWCLPGGNVDDGETLIAAAVRELREEVGVDVIADGAILVVDGPDVGAVEVILRGTINAGEPAISAASGDPYLAECAWLPAAELPDSFRPAALRALLQHPDGLSALPAIDVAPWAR
jgi:ADP-ribose pyrophosphatase YjhB (NUDIX family)